MRSATLALRRLDWAIRPLTLWPAYLLWTFAVNLVTVTLVTYFFSQSTDTDLVIISEFIAQNKLSIIAITSGTFIALYRYLAPLTDIVPGEFIQLKSIIVDFFPSALRGAILGLGVILAFQISRHYIYLNHFLKFDDAVIIFLNSVLRSGLLAIIIYCEEFLFRKKIQSYFSRHIPPMASIVVVSILFTLTKFIQFELNWMTAVTFFMISFGMGLGVQAKEHFSRGAGFLFGLMASTHCLFSLPILGQTMTGLVLMKSQEVGITSLESDQLKLLMTGGELGPFSSLALQIPLLVLVAVRMSRFHLASRRVSTLETSH